MTMKVYRYPENLTTEEDLEFIEGYSNYNKDVWEELPVLPEQYAEILKKGEMSDAIPLVVYVLDGIEDVKDVDIATFAGSGFFNGEFSIYDNKYFAAITEYSSSVFIIPVEYKDELVRHLNIQEAKEDEDIDIDEDLSIKVSSKEDSNTPEELSTASKKMFHNLYLK